MDGRIWGAALGAALEALPAAAFVLSATGYVVRSNAAGAAWLKSAGTTGRRVVADAVHGRRSYPPFVVKELAATGAAKHHLAVMTVTGPTPLDAKGRSEDLAARWRITRRQAEVLAVLAHGHSNKMIAAMLGCTEVTVEAHVTALFGKAGVENRAALVAWFWTAETI